MSRSSQNPLVRYFREIWNGIFTTYVGMRLTIGYFFRRKITLLYPEQRPVIPPGHRGLHAYDEPKCILCHQCANVCPVSCISIESVGKGKTGLPTRYDVDYSKCLFCNLCAEVCPTQCVWLTERYNLASRTREECVLRLARPKTPEEIAAREAELARREAERKAQPKKEA